jgi:hypothetical protein
MIESSTQNEISYLNRNTEFKIFSLVENYLILFETFTVYKGVKSSLTKLWLFDAMTAQW